jgi:L-aminopeptidase/D-esterase-like protein
MLAYKIGLRHAACAALALTCPLSVSANERARDLGIPFEGTPGPSNTITDVPGVEVGQVTRIEGEGELKVGTGPIRTGVTVILPRGRDDPRPVYGGFFNLNGNGEMTGRAYLEDFGMIYGPIGISDSNAIGQVYSGIQQWTSKRFGVSSFPLVAETNSGRLSDIEGFHVSPEMTQAALDAARPEGVREGSVGGGTGTVCFGFKGGIGSASRIVSIGDKNYTVGVLAQCNTGDRRVLRIAGAPVGRAFAQRWLPCFDRTLAKSSGLLPPCSPNGRGGEVPPDQGSIIIVVATDAPLMPIQLNRIARRAALGLARLGSYAGNGSGDLIVSFSTNPSDVNSSAQPRQTTITPLPNKLIDPIFEGATEATEEAIINAMVAAPTMTGINGTRFFGIPKSELQAILVHHRLLLPKAQLKRATTPVTAPHRSDRRQ